MLSLFFYYRNAQYVENVSIAQVAQIILVFWTSMAVPPWIEENTFIFNASVLAKGKGMN